MPKKTKRSRPPKRNCCSVNNRTKTCKRKDGKIFKLPRRFNKTTCLTKKIRGFSMKSSCAPFKYCRKSAKSKPKHKLTHNPKHNPKHKPTPNLKRKKI